MHGSEQMKRGFTYMDMLIRKTTDVGDPEILICFMRNPYMTSNFECGKEFRGGIRRRYITFFESRVYIFGHQNTAPSGSVPYPRTRQCPSMYSWLLTDVVDWLMSELDVLGDRPAWAMLDGASPHYVTAVFDSLLSEFHSTTEETYTFRTKFYVPSALTIELRRSSIHSIGSNGLNFGVDQWLERLFSPAVRRMSVNPVESLRIHISVNNSTDSR
ncbi:hypothetical protein ANN_18980 [Periplaneta americana]|uniref:DDE-1 domain-containing protein n=1 Tax=Periplaneta americana TaxID=6978 RepID=A0ABQ8SQ83_PERAM|nr:hypothetical protein ANN_18980 [Periplaneta americana]